MNRTSNGYSHFIPQPDSKLNFFILSMQSQLHTVYLLFAHPVQLSRGTMDLLLEQLIIIIQHQARFGRNQTSNYLLPKLSRPFNLTQIRIMGPGRDVLRNRTLSKAPRVVQTGLGFRRKDAFVSQAYRFRQIIVYRSMFCHLILPLF